MIESVFKIGQLGKPHGVKGEITFSFSTDVWDRAEVDYLILMLDGILVPFFLEEYRFRGEHSALLKFVNLDSIEAVQELIGVDVYLEDSQVEGVAATDADYTWSYFVGFQVEDATAGKLGEIVRVDESTENVLFEVHTPKGDVLVPAVEAFISDIDHEGRIVHMQLPEGLLDI